MKKKMGMKKVAVKKATVKKASKKVAKKLVKKKVKTDAAQDKSLIGSMMSKMDVSEQGGY